MDPHLETRGSNDLGGAMFKGEHIRVPIQALPIYPTGPSSRPGLIGSPAFFIQQKGEKESKSVKTIPEMLTASPNYKAKVKAQATPKARLVFAKFCNFICFRVKRVDPLTRLTHLTRVMC